MNINLHLLIISILLFASCNNKLKKDLANKLSTHHHKIINENEVFYTKIFDWYLVSKTKKNYEIAVKFYDEETIFFPLYENFSIDNFKKSLPLIDKILASKQKIGFISYSKDGNLIEIQYLREDGSIFKIVEFIFINSEWVMHQRE